MVKENVVDREINLLEIDWQVSSDHPFINPQMIASLKLAVLVRHTSTYLGFQYSGGRGRVIGMRS